MVGYFYIRYILLGLDGILFRGFFRGNFEVCNKVDEDICYSIFNVERECMYY